MKFLDENLLDHLQRPEFAALRESLSMKQVAQNGFICQPDDAENAIFIVASGRARVYLGYEDKEFNLAILAPGDLYSTHTGAYVQAMEAMEILVQQLKATKTNAELLLRGLR